MRKVSIAKVYSSTYPGTKVTYLLFSGRLFSGGHTEEPEFTDKETVRHLKSFSC